MFRRRPSVRPTPDIAFNAASSPLAVPQTELDTVRALCNSTRLTAQSLRQVFSSIGLSDLLYARAVFQLLDIHGSESVPVSQFIVLYSILRKLAFAEGEAALQAAREVVWLVFAAAGGGLDTERLRWPAWQSFLSRFGECIGGVESFPADASRVRMRRAWKKACFPFHKRLGFRGFLCMLRDYDAGLVQNLKAIGFVLSCAVIDSNPQLVVRPVWNGDHESVFMGQFLSYSIAEACAISSGSSLESSDKTPMEAMQDLASFTTSVDQQDALAGTTLMENEVIPLIRKNDLYPDLDKSRGNSTNSSPISMDSAEVNVHSPTSVMSPATSNVRVLRRSNQVRSGNRTPFHIDFSSLKLGDRIGSGAYGDVYKGTFLMSPVAVKMFRLNVDMSDYRDDEDPSHLNRTSTITALKRFASTDSLNKYRNFVREVEMMSVLRHPNLVLYMGACGDPKTPLCIVSELFTGGSLFEYLHNDPKFHPSTNVACSFALNIARGMFYLHASQPSILHRDLKSRNVLLSDRKNSSDGIPHVVICDFGLCQLFGEESHSGTQMGTASYMSPDVISGRKYQACDDVYSYGILLHEIFTGYQPYEGMRAMQVAFRVQNDRLRPTNENDHLIPEAIRKLIEECWHHDRAKRPPFDEIVARLTALDAEMPKDEVDSVDDDDDDDDDDV